MALNRVTRIDETVQVKNVLISLSDKTGLENLVLGLVKTCPEITFYSTGGTYQALEKILGEQSSRLKSISHYTGQPEMQGGLVKTLDFKIYLGLLSETYNDHHQKDLERTQGVNFDLVVVNLYPFEATVAQLGVTPEDARANIDIGGPTMLRAAAKNFLRTAPVCDPSFYGELLESLAAQKGHTTLAQRFRLARETFRRIRDYDQAIIQYLDGIDPGVLAGLYDFQDRK